MIPHPIPYQGSKRTLAAEILRYFPPKFDALYEPFAGSAAMTIAAAAGRLGRHYHINDLNKLLMNLWRAMIETPEEIAARHEMLWHQQCGKHDAQTSCGPAMKSLYTSGCNSERSNCRRRFRHMSKKSSKSMYDFCVSPLILDR